MHHAESYKNEQRNEIQSAYFGHETSSLFTACCYAITGASVHSRIAPHTCINRVIEEMLKLYPQPENRAVIHLWSDGCASQFRSRCVFRITSMFPVSCIIIICSIHFNRFKSAEAEKITLPWEN